jgi:hypothetical protein
VAILVNRSKKYTNVHILMPIFGHNFRTTQDIDMI